MSTTLHRLLYRRLLRLGRQVDDSATLKLFLSRRPQEFYDRHTQMWVPFELDEDEVYRAEEISGFLGGSVHFNPFLRSNQESVEFSTLLKSQARNPNASIERGFKVLGYLDELVNQGDDMLKEGRDRLDDLVARLAQSRYNFDQQLFTAFQPLPAEEHIQEGDLLHAHPMLIHGVLARSIILVCQHSHEDGSLGFVVNHPTPVTLSEVVNTSIKPNIGKVFGDKQIWRGGDVEVSKLHFLHTHGDQLDGCKALANVGGIYVGGRLEDAAELVLSGKAKVEDFQILSGYAGWGTNQLSGEVRQGSWSVMRWQNHDGDMDTSAAKNALCELALGRLILLKENASISDMFDHCRSAQERMVLKMILDESSSRRLSDGGFGEGEHQEHQEHQDHQDHHDHHDENETTDIIKAVLWGSIVRDADVDLTETVCRFPLDDDGFVDYVKNLDSFIYENYEEENL